jgi:hypothetical protein
MFSNGLRAAATLLGLSVVAGLASPGVALAQRCLPPDVGEEQTRLWLLNEVTLSSPGQPATHKLHATDSSQVYWVSDTSTCRQAAVAVATHFEADTLSPPAVYLLRLGPTRYLAFNYARKVYVVLDAEFGSVTRIRMGGYPDLLPAPSHAQGCLQPGDAQAETRIWILRIATSGSPSERAAMEIPSVDSSDVQWVSDTSICRSAGVAMATYFSEDTLSPPGVFVLTIGSTRYLVYNYGRKVYLLFDADLQYVTTYRRR